MNEPLLCRLGIHAWSEYRRPNYVRECNRCGEKQAHRYAPEGRP